MTASDTQSQLTPQDLLGLGLRDAYDDEHKIRLKQLRTGEPARTFDGRGLHPFSLAWGLVKAACMLDPTLEEPDHLELRQRARDDAYRQFVEELR